MNSLSFKETVLKMLHLQLMLTRAGQKTQSISYKNHVPFLVEYFQPSLMCHFMGESPNQDCKGKSDGVLQLLISKPLKNEKCIMYSLACHVISYIIMAS